MFLNHQGPRNASVLSRSMPVEQRNETGLANALGIGDARCVILLPTRADSSNLQHLETQSVASMEVPAPMHSLKIL